MLLAEERYFSFQSQHLLMEPRFEDRIRGFWNVFVGFMSKDLTLITPVELHDGRTVEITLLRIIEIRVEWAQRTQFWL